MFSFLPPFLAFPFNPVFLPGLFLPRLLAFLGVFYLAPFTGTAKTVLGSAIPLLNLCFLPSYEF